MSILSTNHRLISIGESYSAGNGIDITDQVISVTGDAIPYSAGENIYIQDHIISGKDWSNDITEASSHAYNETTAWVKENYANSADMTYISAVVDTKLDASAWSTVSADYATEDYVIMADNITFDRAKAYVDSNVYAIEEFVNENTSGKLDSTAFTNWQNGQYSTDLQTIEGQISNKLDETAFGEVSGSFLTAINIPESAVWQDVSTTVQTNSAQWTEGGAGDEEVNSFVYNNSATINEVNTTYQANSGSYQPSGNYIPYTAVDPVFNAFQTNSGLQITTARAGNLRSTDIYDDYISVTYIDSNIGLFLNSTLTNDSLTFKTSSNSAYLDKEKIHTWDSASNYIQSNSANWNEVSTTVQTNSAQWGQGGGAISSYTTYYSVDVPPFGDEVINSLNGMFISAFVSQSADNAKQSIEAESAKSANSANYAETVNETYLENKGFSRNLSSEYGTVSIVNNNIIESTNSAIVRTVNEGFVSSYSGQTLGPVGNGIATYSWDKSLPNTIIALNFPSIKNEILTYSANTNLTGEIALPADTPAGGYTQTINIPNATEFKVWANNWVYVYQVVVSAADQFETVVGELAWASALPTYEYDSTNKISAINGSALAGGGDVPSGTMNTSALEYNAVGEISGFGSSAIAQYGAEKQWLVHDDTLVHAANSAQYALGVNVSALQRLMGIDETVLWSGSIYTTAQSAGLSDSVFNYNSVKFYYTPYKEPQRRLPQIRETVFDNTELTDSQPYLMHEMIYYMAGGSITGECFYSQISDNGSTLRLINGIRTVNFNAATTGITAFSSCLSKIVGIGRKA